ncbi:transcription factor 12-like isoform X1 [Asterias rubens]|uniref:transcription factor 12-like isoform X1 n=1 Tax=Asterias rubens TaxID=7604 RepID=UPI001455205C|nr:transcription factor 12-like isoform X1 [Asterias rubens]
MNKSRVDLYIDRGPLNTIGSHSMGCNVRGMDGGSNSWSSQPSPSFDTRGYEHSHSTTYGEMNDRIMDGMPSNYVNSSSAMSSIMAGKSKDPYTMPYPSMSRESNITPNAQIASGMPALTSDMATSGSALSPHAKSGAPYYYGPHHRRRPHVPEHPSYGGPHKRRKGPSSGLTVYPPNGQDEYHHSADPSSYPSPKPPGICPSDYFIDATAGTHSPHSTDPWSSNGLAPSSASFHSSSILGNSGSSYSQSQTTYPPHEPMGYGQSQGSSHVHGHTMSPNRDPLSLPSMTSFKPGTTSSSTHLHSPYSSSSPSNGTETILSVRGGSTAGSTAAGNSQTGDTLGKALASIYSADHTNSSFPSNPSTPVGSPPPMSGPWPRSSTQASPGPYVESHLHSLQSRMEERLDDAINVLQRHAEGALQAMPNHPAGGIGPPPAHTGSSGMNVGPAFGTSGQYIDSHMSGSPSVERNAVAGPVPASDLSQTQQPFNAVQGELLSQSMDTDRKPTPKPKKSKTSPSHDKLKLNNSKDTHNKLPESEDPSTTQNTRKELPVAAKSKKQYDDYTSVNGDDSEEDASLTPEQKHVKEKERRHANNARERIRVRDINEAFKELGRMTCIHLKSDKAQTKLSILHQAVSVITSLEQQVRERNLNPKAACLKRREEEKVEERNMAGGGGPPSTDSMNSPPGMGSSWSPSYMSQSPGSACNLRQPASL